MKTSDASTNRPVQSSTDNKTPRTEKKPQKEFDKVLNENKGQKKTLIGKEKPFSPMGSKHSAGEKKATSEKKGLHEALAEGKSEKQGTSRTEHRDYNRIEAKGEKEREEQDLFKKESSKDLLQPMTLQGQQSQPQTNVQEVSQVQATQRPGLNINEIQSIVNRVELGANDKGHPEFRFELQTKNLGNLDLKVSTEGDKVSIEIATQDVRAQEAIKENLKELTEMLNQKGLMLAEMKFEQRGQDSEKQEKERDRREQADDGISPIDGGPRRKFSLS